MNSPIAHRVLMVRPRSFRANEETIATNAFQNADPGDRSNSGAGVLNSRQKAREEFDRLHAALVAHDIEVELFEEPAGADTPDALFPNNWFASMPDGRAYLFPMLAKNRRREVRPEWITQVLPQAAVTDLRAQEDAGVFLEGTGSLIFDHKEKTGYACYSPRTQKIALEDFARRSGYRMIGFDARDASGGEYYHTNVIMALGSKLAIVCVESIINSDERAKVLAELETSGHRLLAITRAQVNDFTGNMIELANVKGERFWVCSERAWAALKFEQRAMIEADATVIKTALPTIERLGGGGARCMIGELF